MKIPRIARTVSKEKYHLLKKRLRPNMPQRHFRMLEFS